MIQKMTKTKKILTTLTILICLTLFSSQTAFATSNNTSDLDEFLPSREDIEDQFHEVEYQNLTLNENNFLEGKSVTYSRLYDNDVIISLQFNIYLFSNTESANTYYDKIVNQVKTDGGYRDVVYTEIEIPSAFAIIEDDRAEIANSWSVSNNIVMNLEVYNDWNEDTEQLLITYTQLEMDIIPEFPSWTAIPLFLIATVTAIIIRKKFSLH